MKVKSFIILVTLFLGISVNAESTVYGKLWITVESQKISSGTEVDMISNASRLGVKGSTDFSESLEAIYQVEYEVDPVDGTADELKDRTFKQRNSFVGIKGSYGTFFLGKHDTAFKESQAKIDLFNDLAGDIENILYGENRMNDFVGYTTATFGGGISATFNAIKGTGDMGDNSVRDTTSISLNYKTDLFYAALSIDSEVKGYDSTRLSLQIPFNKMQLGFIYQDTENLSNGVKEDGYVVSVSRKIGNKGVLKVQVAESDMKLVSGRQTSFGYDYKLGKSTKVFFFFTDLSGNKESKEKEISALGIEYNF